MGSTAVPFIVNLFMAKLEKDIICNNITNPFFEDMIFYGHFLDYILLITQGQNECSTMLKWFNSLHPAISFLHNQHKKAIPFLDTIIYKTTKNTLGVHLFTKPTDRTPYLHYSSCHSKSLRNNIPYGQLLRVKRNSTNNNNFEQDSKRVVNKFLLREYPKHVIFNSLSRTRKKLRSELLATKTRTCKNICCSIQFNHLAHNITSIIYRH